MMTTPCLTLTQAEVLAAFDRVQTYNLASLLELRAACPHIPRPALDRELTALRRAGVLFAAGAEGRHGLTAEERAAALVEYGEVLLYVGRR